MCFYYCIIRGQYGVLHEGIVFSWYFRTQSGGAAMHTESLYRRGVWGLWHTMTTVAQLVNTGMIGEDRSSYGWFTLFGDHFQHDFLGNIYIYIIHQLTSLCNPRSFYVLQPVAVCENILSDILPWILGGWLGWCCHQNRVCHPDKSQDSKTAKTVRFDRIPVSITRSSLMFSKRAWICLGWRLLNWICTILHNVFLSWHGVPQFVAKIRS